MIPLLLALSLLTHYPRRCIDWRVPSSGIVSAATLDSVARYDIVVADAGPLVAFPGLAALLHIRNPRLVLLAYISGGVWNNPHPAVGDTLTDFWYARWRVARDYQAAFDSRDPTDNVDRAIHRAMIALADVDAKAAKVADGMFLDTVCLTPWWEPDSTANARGWDTMRDWARAYREGHRLYVERLRERAGDKTLIVGNCGPSGERDLFNGWMRENFPHQNGGSWMTNMVSYAGDPGYIPDGALYRQPSLMLLSNALSGDSRWDRQRFLYSLASATLGDGAYEQLAGGPRAAWFPWPPEYDMDLGQPSSPAYRTGAWTWRREFTKGYVEVDVLNETGRMVVR